MAGPANDPLVGRLLDGRYKVGRRIARGGMATVYEARDIRLDRIVAVKVMHPDLAQDHGFVARFIGEARSAARLSHPHVVAVYDQGEEDGIVFLAMEYVHGRTLRQVVSEESPLDVGQAMDLIEPVLGALGAAHRAGLVHRDVKPENVLVGERTGAVKVADFGLARALSAVSGNATSRGLLLGTVAYISPEQAVGEPATPRTDVYAAGIVLYEMLTGVQPHDGATDFVIVRKHIDEDVPAPSAVRSGIPAALDEFVRTATARDPERRFSDGLDALAALTSARRQIDAAPPPEPWDAAGVSADQAFVAAPVMAGAAGPLAGPSPDDQPTTRIAMGPVAPPATHDTAPQARTNPVDVRPAGAVALADEDPDLDLLAGGPDDPDDTGSLPARRTGRRWRRRLGWLLVLLVLVGAAAGGWWFVQGRYVPAPSLLGLTQSQAAAKAAEQGFAVRALAPEYSETVAADLVLDTDPDPGDRVIRNGTVGLVLSRGPERYEVPQITGKSRDEVAAVLEPLTLGVGPVTEQYDEAVPTGVVIAQNPEPGASVKRDTAVSLVVSKGREPLGVPDTVGKPQNEATAALEAVGFVVTPTQAFSDTVPRGVVIDQAPRSGTLFRGDAVALTLSKGPEKVEVPRVEGRSAAEAKAALEAVGFAVKQVVVLPAGPGNVLRQTPAEGSKQNQGSTVTIYVF